MTQRNKKFLIVAGETSGDQWGGLLVNELRSQNPGAEFFGIGLDKMKNTGVDLLLEPAALLDLSVVGALENIGKVPALLNLRRAIVDSAKSHRPDAAILIDYPGFNLSLAKKLHAQDIPLFFYPPPQLWLWGAWRQNKLRTLFRKLLVFFPFEEEFYRDIDIRAQWVGHPAFQDSNGTPLPQKHPRQIALLPGSRFSSISHQLPPMLDAARILHRSDPSRRFIIPLAPLISKEWVERQIAEDQDYISVVDAPASNILSSSAMSIVGAGTAALEAAFCQTPMVLCGKYSRPTYWSAKYLLRIQPEGIVNRLAGKSVTKEFWQWDVTGPNLAQAAEDLLRDEVYYRRTVDELEKIRTIFQSRKDGSARAARAIMEDLS